MVSRRSELDSRQFSWRRTCAITFSVVLHAMAFMVMLAPIMPPEAKAFVPKRVTVVDVIEQPQPAQLVPAPPAMPEPPRPHVVEAINLPETPTPQPVVAVEPSPMARAVLPSKPSMPSQRTVPIDVAPGANLSYLRYHKPPYPVRAVRMRHEGTVILRVLVGVNGSVLDIKIDRSSGYRELDQAAVRAAREWMFNPGIRDGIAYKGWALVPVDFALNR